MLYVQVTELVASTSGLVQYVGNLTKGSPGLIYFTGRTERTPSAQTVWGLIILTCAAECAPLLCSVFKDSNVTECDGFWFLFSDILKFNSHLQQVYTLEQVHSLHTHTLIYTYKHLFFNIVFQGYPDCPKPMRVDIMVFIFRIPAIRIPWSHALSNVSRSKTNAVFLKWP